LYPMWFPFSMFGFPKCAWWKDLCVVGLLVVTHIWGQLLCQVEALCNIMITIKSLSGLVSMGVTVTGFSLTLPFTTGTTRPTEARLVTSCPLQLYYTKENGLGIIHNDFFLTFLPQPQENFWDIYHENLVMLWEVL
jgi:hypothetical protein